MTSVRLRVGIGVVFWLATGCASDRDAIDRRLAGLSEDISRLQATNDRLVQRVDALEVERSSVRQQGSKSGAKLAAAPVEHAPLKVVKLEPAESGIATLSARTPDVAPAERPDAPGERPVIRLRGRGDSKSDNKGGDGPPRESVRVVEEGEGK
jgi:hypothetical protein